MGAPGAAAAKPTKATRATMVNCMLAVEEVDCWVELGKLRRSLDCRGLGRAGDEGEEMNGERREDI